MPGCRGAAASDRVGQGGTLCELGIPPMDLPEMSKVTDKYMIALLILMEPRPKQILWLRSGGMKIDPQNRPVLDLCIRGLHPLWSSIWIYGGRTTAPGSGADCRCEARTTSEFVKMAPGSRCGTPSPGAPGHTHAISHVATARGTPAFGGSACLARER